MAEYLSDLLSSLRATIFIIAFCTLLEWVSPQQPFRWRARWPGIIFGMLVPVWGLLVMTPLKMLWLELGVGPLLTLPVGQLYGPAAATLAVLLLNDFLAYWEHRFEHRFMWPVHAVHHSVEDLSAATTYSHPLQFLSIFVLIGIPLSLVDFGPQASTPAVMFLVALSPIVIHSPIRVGFGPLRHLVVDPRYHRVHHSLERRHFDRNFAIMFSFWDRLFGTSCMPAKDEWPDVGIHEARSPRSVTELLLYPYRLWRLKRDHPDTATLPLDAERANRRTGLGV